MSGSARAIERLKTQYEINEGDVDFDDEEDIMTIAGLIKLFLRELPDSVIPADVVRQFLQVQAGEFHLVMLMFAFLQCVTIRHIWLSMVSCACYVLCCASR